VATNSKCATCILSTTNVLLTSDKRYNSCAAPEKPPTPLEEEDLIHNIYTAGSVVWGRLAGYPWWPAMVDDDPDTEQYYWINSFSDIPVSNIQDSNPLVLKQSLYTFLLLSDAQINTYFFQFGSQFSLSFLLQANHCCWHFSAVVSS
jgi:hypothetical protein